MLRLAFLVSGGGTNMQAVIDACSEGRIKAVPEVVIASNDKAYALERAKIHSINRFVVSRSDYPNSADREKRIIEILEHYKIDLIILAGYLTVLSSDFASRYADRIINIHPSLLPKYGGKGMYGINVHRAVIESKDEFTGATVHYVDGGTDTGKIIAQRVVRVQKNDTPESLQERVLKEAEHDLLCDVLSDLCKDCIN